MLWRSLKHVKSIKIVVIFFDENVHLLFYTYIQLENISLINLKDDCQFNSFLQSIWMKQCIGTSLRCSSYMLYNAYIRFNTYIILYIYSIYMCIHIHSILTFVQHFVCTLVIQSFPWWLSSLYYIVFNLLSWVEICTDIFFITICVINILD